MLNAEQNRNYDRCQRLHVFLDNNGQVYNTYVPFTKEKQNFTINFNLLKTYAPQKDVKGKGITKIQKALKMKIGNSVLSICAMATSYAQEYNNPALMAAMKCSKSGIAGYKDADMYGMVLNIVNTLQPFMSDAHFMEYDITNVMLSSLMNDATQFSNNLGTASFIDSGSSIANKNINEVINLLDGNVTQFDRLVYRFASSHPDFVAGYRINAALENPATRHTGIEGTVTVAGTDKPVADAVITLTLAEKKNETVTDGSDRKKETVSGSGGKYSIISMYGGTYQLVVTAPGFAPKTLEVRINRSKISKLDIAL